MKKNKRKNFFAAFARPWLMANAGGALIFVAAVLWLSASLRDSDRFLVRQVIIREKDDITSGESSFAYFKGKNIFRIDLDREAARIARSYPSFRKIRLTRYLPDCVVVDFLRRRPVAAVRGTKSCYIDENGYFFDEPGDAQVEGLPVVTGLERRADRQRQGTPREIILSLQVIHGMDGRPLSGFRIREIDVSAPDNLAFFLIPAAQSAGDQPRQAQPQGIEVRVGDDGVPGKMQILSTVLTQMRATVENIKYIDLRFREPVIKFKNMDKFSTG